MIERPAVVHTMPGCPAAANTGSSHGSCLCTAPSGGSYDPRKVIPLDPAPRIRTRTFA